MRGFLKHLGGRAFTDERLQKLKEATDINSAGYDPWGLNVETTERSVRYLQWLYRDYFRVEAIGLDKIPEGRVMLVANHSGQLPIDGIVIALALMLDADPPRIVRGMVARWFPKLPFIGTWFIRCGQVVGDPENCIELLRADNAIMVFPEGEPGIGKPYRHRYNMTRWGTGFLRIAQEAKAPIIPIAVVGAEEIYPSLHNFPLLSKMIGVPYIPITPFFPLLGPLGMLPLPHRIQLRFGDPIVFDGDEDEDDFQVEEKVKLVRGAVEALIDEGLAERPHLAPRHRKREKSA